MVRVDPYRVTIAGGQGGQVMPMGCYRSFSVLGPTVAATVVHCASNGSGRSLRNACSGQIRRHCYRCGTDIAIFVVHRARPFPAGADVWLRAHRRLPRQCNLCCSMRDDINFLPSYQVFGCVRMDDFLAGLAQRVKSNGTSLDIFRCGSQANELHYLTN